jgi:HAD superfamily hydrolase (TIGR01450 family)
VNLVDIKLFMLDMDGTFYIENKLLPGAQEFINLCRKQNIKFTFLTNNSSKSSSDYIEKLKNLGVIVNENEMLTSGDACIEYLALKNYPKDIYLVGTQSLHNAFRVAGFNTNSTNPKAVVLGFDTTLDYEKLCTLCDVVRTGVPYIATHPDFNCPVKNGYIPDVGAVIAFVKAATLRKPNIIIGKPNKTIAKMAAKRAGVPLQKTCMVGDRLYTDIALGKTGVQTVLVLSGEGKISDVAFSKTKPNFIFKNLDELKTALMREIC